VTVERYPQLKATGNIGQLQEELSSTENRIAFARQLYNDTRPSTTRSSSNFPRHWSAGLAHASARPVGDRRSSRTGGTAGLTSPDGNLFQHSKPIAGARHGW